MVKWDTVIVPILESVKKQGDAKETMWYSQRPSGFAVNRHGFKIKLC